MSDPLYIGAGTPDIEGVDEHGPFLQQHISPSHVAHCSSCGRQTRVVVIRSPETDEEAWFGLCCDARGDALPEDERFPFGR
ncbi:Uncharacterised protein (plasmid) [Tsukamurella tyrosinosolvens]|uniref:Uncharacterized protein n=1 Tax=Tsukamurella tyrosinosolvens TaxID=57704 RepID=A0A1H4UYY2_TSUTY|nr:hypothetical protein [Tsukamurella tyrosinosolvens]KXO91101.1 hypothetical protein AXK58_21975 [Tsukamurella tyrosinosolvens]SEC73863.1 hypothetical protein SAMN04489793_3083 [Tsukamurella tyrosinosolvens]VEH90795.1 Uncharacterised protein [Tsukamurella tyrosinosolvens]